MSPVRKKTSLKDIAAELGVSTTLVSYVLNDKFKDRINPQTAQRIRDMARELNYRTNHVAKSLKNDKTFTIGLIIADISNFFYSGITRYIEDEFRKHKYHVIFGSADENKDRFDALIDVFISRQVDGIILAAPSGSEEILAQLQAQKIPFVLIDRFFPGLEKISSVTLDNYKASADVVSHLVEMGYKRPAMITLQTELYHLHERTRGFQESYVQHNLEKDPLVIQLIEERLGEEIHGIVTSILEEKQVDVLYLATNKIALEVLAVLANSKIKVPEELAIVCFDEVDAYKIFNTSITYVKQPLHLLGAEAVSILIDQISGKEQGEVRILNSCIVPGDSTAPLVSISKEHTTA